MSGKRNGVGFRELMEFCFSLTWDKQASNYIKEIAETDNYFIVYMEGVDDRYIFL